MATEGGSESYPLEAASDADLRELSRALWGWHECPAAAGNGASCGPACPWSRYYKLAHFHSLYRELASSYVPDLYYGCSPALRHHKDLSEIIRCLKAHPDVPRTQLMLQYFGARRLNTAVEAPTPEDQERAFTLAARVMTSVACSSEDVESAILELGTEPVPWRGAMSISQFLLAAFPLSNTLSLAPLPGSRRNNNVRPRLSAETITKTGRLRVQPTDDIRNHLRIDIKSRTLQVYQQTSALKENLRATQNLSATATVAEAIRA